MKRKKSRVTAASHESHNSHESHDSHSSHSSLLSPTPRVGVVLAAGYVAVVLAIDTLAVQGKLCLFDWEMFRWSPMSLYLFIARVTGGHPPGWLGAIAHSSFGVFDLFKFVFWFLVPLAFCVRRFDWGWVLPLRWKKVDYLVCGAGIVLCGGAVLAIPFIPALHAFYGGGRHSGIPHPASFFLGKMIWTFSWLVGWEFMHRYFLVRACERWWPYWGWLLVPLSETLYHLQKPVPEMIAMGCFSLVATGWTVWRKNMLQASLAHAAVEISLWIFVLFS